MLDTRLIAGAIVAAALGMTTACASSPQSLGSDTSDAACGPYAEKILFKGRGVPYSERISREPLGSAEGLLRRLDRDGIAGRGAALGGEPPAARMDSANGSTTVFSGPALAATEKTRSLSTFFRGGGLILDEAPAIQADVVEELLTTEGTAAKPVKIGQYDGLINRADEIDGRGARPYHVLWRAEGKDYRIIAGGSPQRAILAARDIACS